MYYSPKWKHMLLKKKFNCTFILNLLIGNQEVGLRDWTRFNNKTKNDIKMKQSIVF